MQSMPPMITRFTLILLCGIVLAIPVAGAQDGSYPRTPWRYALYLKKEPVDPFILAVLDATNLARTNAIPAPSPALPPMEWDAGAAAVAQAWAEKCLWQHNGDRTSQYKALTGSEDYVGENLYVVYGNSRTNEEVATAGITSWADEIAEYDYNSNSCSGICGHYTQLVWRSTTAVGCGVAYCPTIEGIGWGGKILACNYVPGGNYSGQRPY